MRIDIPVGLVGGDARLTLRYSDSAGGCVLIGVFPTGGAPVVTLELDRNEWRRLVGAGDLLLDLRPPVSSDREGSGTPSDPTAAQAGE